MIRTALTWRILDEDFVGTCHVPSPGRAGGIAGARSAGLLLLNPGSAMRSGNSDLSARIGDRLALRGIPVFRFDLAGLGDSSGSRPDDLDSFFDEVMLGRNDAATVALIERIQREFGVARVFVGGLCAAAMPAVRALGAGHASPAGLVLLEPNFRQAPPPPAMHKGAAMHKLERDGAGEETAGESRMERVTRPVRAFLSGVLERVASPSPPRDTNAALLAHWQAGVARGVRSLVVVADGSPTDRYVTRILAAMSAREAEAVACVRVPGTNHLFTAGNGRAHVLAALERWMLGSAA